MMKKSFIILLLFLVFEAKATHLGGGQIAVKYIGRTGPNQLKYIYEITITIFRDCKNGQGDFDDPMTLGVFKLSNNDPIQNVDFNLLSRQVITSFPAQQLCYEIGIYKKQIIVDEDFYVTTSRCCRAFHNNIVDDIGSTIYTDVHTYLSGSYIPLSVYNQPIVIGTGKNHSFDLSSPDTLSDSTIYEFSNPLQGGDKNQPKPDPGPKPYLPVPYKAGYNLINPLGSLDLISIDRLNGMLSLNINTLGSYALGVTVTKFKNGTVLYKQVRDLTIISCPNCISLFSKNDEIKMSGLKTFPNPSGNTLNLNLEGYPIYGPVEVSIFNTEGRLMKKETLNKLKTIDISDLTKGIYLLQVMSDNKISYSKFCKI